MTRLEKQSPPAYHWFLFISLGIALVISYNEIRAVFNVAQNWEKLLSTSGILTISLYLAILLAGLYYLFTNRSRGEGDQPAPVVTWVIVAGLLLITSWIFLFSPWQTILAGPWSQLLFSAVLAKIIQVWASPYPQWGFRWSELALILAIFIYPRAVHELRALIPIPIIYRGATAIGFVFTLVIAFLLYHPVGDRLRAYLIHLREQMGKPRWLIALLLCAAPLVYYCIVGAETYTVYPNIRFSVLLIALWVAAGISSTGAGRVVSRDSLGLNFGVLLLVSAFVRGLLLVVDYPFSLSWSEGNRFYDYSLVFGQSLYNYPGHIVNPYSSPGRYGLWGILFLWQGLPIWAHRFWNLILQTLPVLIFSFLITRKLKPSALRYGVMLWIALFLIVLAPLHPPFMVVSIIIAAFAFDEHPVRRAASLAIASLYASASRLTWIFVPAALGGLIDLLLYYPKRSGTFFRRLTPTVLLILAGLIPGLLPSLPGYLGLAQGESLTASQPLLWYRLLPNDTLGPGILFLALRYMLPLLIMLAWWTFSQHWQLDWIQKLAIWSVLIGFFAIGLVISTKIGGGGDLHNLDMFLITLIVVAVLWLTTHNTSQIKWPVWTVGLFCLLMFWVVYPFTPLHPEAALHPRLNLPDQKKVSEAFSVVRDETAKFAQLGEVLFMDHRQLLTFGYIPAVPFVPEYEKKYMMDQAMGNNASYFEAYYHDLSQKRFALIVTEPLRTTLKEDLGGPFSEENDAWIIWVSNPTLCFYEPIYLSKEVNVELLVPKQNPVGCEQYLKPGEIN